jgi:hypothetical protein
MRALSIVRRRIRRNYPTQGRLRRKQPRRTVSLRLRNPPAEAETHANEFPFVTNREPVDGADGTGTFVP